MTGVLKETHARHLALGMLPHDLALDAILITRLKS